MIVTDQQVDLAAEIVERHMHEALEAGDDLRDTAVYAVHAVRQAWRLGLVSEDPDLSEPPRMAMADLN
jgi:hypothetical protein